MLNKIIMSWAEVKKINSNLNKPLDTLIAEKALAGIVKSIQILDVSDELKASSYQTRTFTISPVNLSKTIVVGNNHSHMSGSVGNFYGSQHLRLTSNTQVIEHGCTFIYSGSSYTYFNMARYYIVEFY